MRLRSVAVGGCLSHRLGSGGGGRGPAPWRCLMAAAAAAAGGGWSRAWQQWAAWRWPSRSGGANLLGPDGSG